MQKFKQDFSLRHGVLGVPHTSFLGRTPGKTHHTGTVVTVLLSTSFYA